MNVYTKIPNDILDNLGSFTESELKILLAVYRKTAGYHKTSDRISFAQLQKLTKLSRASVNTALKSDNIHKFLTVESTSKGNIFTPKSGIKSEPIDNKVVQNLNQSGKKSEPILVQNLNPQKKRKKLSKRKGEPFYEIPTQKQVEKYFKDHAELMLPKDIPIESEKFINHYSERNWKTQSGKRIKNWRRQAGTWYANYKQFQEKRIKDYQERHHEISNQQLFGDAI